MNIPGFRGLLSEGPEAERRRRLFVYVVIPLVSLALHLHVIPRDLVGFHAWRQSQTQINVDNFYSEDFNILNPRIDDRGDGDGISRMEFPLMQWLFALGYRLLFPGFILTRLMSFCIGVMTIAGMYHLIRNVFRDARLAAPGAWAFAFSPVFYYYIVNPMPDNLALCAGVWGMALFFRYLRSDSLVHASLSAAAIGVATLAKLPFVLCIAGVGAHVIAEAVRQGGGNHPGTPGRRRFGRLAAAAAIYALFLVPAAIWYAAVIPQWRGNGIVGGILANELPARELINIARFTVVSTLPELLINYGSVVFFLAGGVLIIRRRLYARPGFAPLAGWGVALVLYFIFEMNMIRYVHDYYLIPFLPPIFLIVSYGIGHLLHTRSPVVRNAAIACLLILPLAAFLRINHRWNLESPGFNRDLLVYKEELRRAVPDGALCVVGDDESHHIYFYHLGKKGWGFEAGGLDRDTLKEMIRRGARYLYSDSRQIDGDEKLAPFLDELVLERGSFKVFRLKSAGGD
jgi:hypothetical protein